MTVIVFSSPFGTHAVETRLPRFLGKLIGRFVAWSIRVTGSEEVYFAGVR